MSETEQAVGGFLTVASASGFTNISSHTGTHLRKPPPLEQENQLTVKM